MKAKDRERRSEKRAQAARKAGVVVFRRSWCSRPAGMPTWTLFAARNGTDARCVVKVVLEGSSAVSFTDYLDRVGARPVLEEYLAVAFADYMGDEEGFDAKESLRLMRVGNRNAVRRLEFDAAWESAAAAQQRAVRRHESEAALRAQLRDSGLSEAPSVDGERMSMRAPSPSAGGYPSGDVRTRGTAAAESRTAPAPAMPLAAPPPAPAAPATPLPVAATPALRKAPPPVFCEAALRKAPPPVFCEGVLDAGPVGAAAAAPVTTLARPGHAPPREAVAMVQGGSAGAGAVDGGGVRLVEPQVPESDGHDQLPLGWPWSSTGGGV